MAFGLSKIIECEHGKVHACLFDFFLSDSNCAHLEFNSVAKVKAVFER